MGSLQRKRCQSDNSNQRFTGAPHKSKFLSFLALQWNPGLTANHQSELLLGACAELPELLPGDVVRHWDKTCSCYGKRQTLFEFLSSSHLSLNREGRWGTIKSLISPPVSSIFPCSPLPSGTWRTPGPVHSLMLSSRLFLCLPLTLLSHNVLCLIRVAHARFLSHTTHRPMVTSKSVVRHCLIVDGGLN